MKRLILTLALIGAFGALAYWVFTHPSRQRVQKLRAEYESLRGTNERLADENDRLRREIVALRNDPRVAQRHARMQGSLARPNEVILQFDDGGEGRRPLQVVLRVGSDRAELAGEQVALPELDEALDDLREELPEARLNVSFDEGIGPLRRERVIDIVDGSSFSSPEYKTAAK